MNDDLRTQAALYALDALPSGERADFLKAVAADPVLAQEVAALRDAAACVAYAATPCDPPPGLKESILARVRAERSAAVVPAAERNPRAGGSGLASLIPWAMAAGFAVFAGVLWNGNQRLQSNSRELVTQREVAAGLYDRLADMERQLGERTVEVSRLQATIVDLEEKNRLAGVQVATLTSKLDASYLASIVWDKDSQEGILNVRRLPVSGAEKDYQLWVIDPKLSAPVSAGVFKVNDDGSATVKFAPIQPVDQATTFAVTLERTGGVPKAEGPVVLAN